MLIVALEALGLMLLIYFINGDEDVGFGKAFGVALAAVLLTELLAWGVVSLLGPYGVLLALVISAAALGFAVCAFFGVEIKRALAIACLFMLLHLVVSFGVAWLKESMLGSLSRPEGNRVVTIDSQLPFRVS